MPADLAAFAWFGVDWLAGPSLSGEENADPRPGRPILVDGRTAAPLAGASWQPPQVGVGGLSRLDADPAVDGLDAVGAGDDGAPRSPGGKAPIWAVPPIFTGSYFPLPSLRAGYVRTTSGRRGRAIRHRP